MSALRRMFPYVRPYRWTMVMELITVIIPVIMQLVVPRMLQYVIDQGIHAVNFSVILQGSMLMLITALVGAVATLAQGVFRARLSQGIAFDLRNTLFGHIQKLSFADLDKMQTGQLMTRLSSDVDVLRMFLSASLALILRAVVMIIGATIMLTLTDLRLSIIMFLMLGVAAVIIRWIMATATPLFTVVQERLSALNTIVQENFAGVEVVKAFVRERFEISRFETGNAAYMQQNVKVGRLLAVVMPVLAIVTNVGIVAVVWWGGMDVIGGRLSIGQLVAFNNYLMIGMQPLLLLSNSLTMISRAEASATRVLEVLDTEPAIQTIASPYQTETVRGEIAFDNVAFRYERDDAENSVLNDQHPLISAVSHNGLALHTNGTNGANGMNGDVGKPVLNGVNFDVKPGQRIAFLGATGSGKSTVVNLIPRFYDVTGGRIKIDDVDVREWETPLLRKRIGMVPQQTILFSGTIRENIAYGRPNASMEEVIGAAKAAQAHDFIMAMPQGYDSFVEAHGANLSGGQKQRIAIARALILNPAILILDDCTSAVDMDTEFKIQEALDTMLKDSTTFIVAQRISSVLSADQIIILDAGRIAAKGTHRELLQTSPIYQDIYRSQFGIDNLDDIHLTTEA